MQTIAQTLEVAKQRVSFTRDLVALGDRSAIDTVEAQVFATQIQNDYTKAAADLQVALLRLSNHIWDNEGNPSQISEGVIPLVPRPVEQRQPSLFQVALHPIVQQYEYRQRILSYQRKLKTEKFKPVLNLNYNLLTAGTNTDGFGLSSLSPNNYKVGVQMYFPLAVREATGAVRKIRLQESELDLTRRRREQETNNLVSQTEIELQASLEIWQQTELLVEGQTQMVEGEQTRFENGESSLFILNSRQQKLLETSLKANENAAKWAISLAKRAWAYGRPEDWTVLINPQ